MQHDVIIIGAGLGGLTAGAKLAKEGKQVLLIEQHVVPGGCATTFKRKKLMVEVGLHEMDGLDKGDPKVKIFEDLDVYRNVEFVRVPEFYRFISKNVDIVIPDNYKRATDILVERFPHEEKGIKKFFNVVIGMNKEINKMPREKWKFIALLPVFPLLYRNVMTREKGNLGDFLDSIIHDEDLKLVLLANLGYYHDNPYTMSMVFYAAAQGSYFSGGGHFVKGGSQKLSDYLASVIKSYGGEILLKHLVTEIIIKDNKAIGVRYKKKSGSDTEIQEAFGSHIVANAAIPNVVNELLPASEARDKLASIVSKQEVACSLISIYLGFKRPLKELGNSHYSTFLLGEDIVRQSEWAGGCRADWSKRGFVFVDYGQIDSQLAPEGKSVGVICTFDYLSDWEDLSKKEYQAKKEEVTQVLIERLDKIIPGIKEEIEYCEAGTAKTIKRYTLNPKGTAYGFAQLPEQSGRKRIPQKSPIENLYFASAWSMPGHGFSGAIIGGFRLIESMITSL